MWDFNPAEPHISDSQNIYESGDNYTLYHYTQTLFFGAARIVHRREWLGIIVPMERREIAGKSAIFGSFYSDFSDYTQKILVGYNCPHVIPNFWV